jgi:hypothetical protein
VILRSFDEYDVLVSFSPESGKIERTSQAELGTGRELRVEGEYAYLGNVLVAVYRSEDQLYFQAQGQIVALDSSTTVDHQCEGGLCRLKVRQSGQGGKVIQVDYLEPDLILPIEDDPTPFIDAEQFDFGLFVSNLAKDSDRCSRVYR